MPQCKYRKQDGNRCRAHAMRKAKFCISHNPKARELKRAATAKGGRNRKTLNRAPKPPEAVAIRNIGDVRDMLLRTLEDLRNGRVDSDLARAVGYLAGVTAKIIETADLEPQLQKLEESYSLLFEKSEYADEH